jgi:hypothetical protein
VDFPDKNKFLTPEQTAFVKARVEQDSADTEHDPLTLKKALVYACDLKLWGKSLSEDFEALVNADLSFYFA